MNSTELTAGALFAGIGGFCLGFKSVGINTAWAVENDLSCNETYKKNIKDSPIIEIGGFPASIKNITASMLEPVDVLHAGFPCQSFSQAGNRRGFADERGKLFFEIIRIIKEFKDKKPSVLVFENSPYLRSGENGSWFLELSKEIKKAGYWFKEQNCCELDTYDITELPQKRNRLFMVAFSIKDFKNGRFEFPKKIKTKKDLGKYINFDSSFKDDDYYLSGENRYFHMINEQVEDKKCIYQLRKFLVRVKEKNVCPTLTANMGLGGHNVPFIHDKKGIRKLTEYECLALQGFPKSFKFPIEVARAKRYAQIGNAVSVPVIEQLAKNVKEKVINDRG